MFLFLLQIKEGAEKLREVAKDRRALSDVASIVKKSNTKLAELKSELHELESQIILTQGNSNGKGKQNNFLIKKLSSGISVFVVLSPVASLVL